MSIDVNRATALTLRAGIVTGVILMVIGLIQYGLDGTETVLYYGVLLLIVSPFIGVLVTFGVLVIDRDWKWVTVAAVLVIVTVIGIIISIE